MAKTTETLLVEISADVKDLKQGLKESRADISNFSKSATALGGVLAGIFAVDKIKDFAIESAKLAGVAEGVEAAFTKLNKPTLLSELRSATRGTVSDLELMKAAVKAENFKVPLEKLGKFFQFATQRSAQTGESVDYLVESIVNGIGRKSSLVLDNLGISAAELQGEIKKVGDFGLAAGNIIERELAKGGEVATTSAQKMASWGASIDNLKVAIGKELNKVLALLAPTIDSITSNLISGFNKGREYGIQLANVFIDLYNESAAFRGIVEGLKFVFKTTFDFLKTVLTDVANKFKNLGAGIVNIFKGEFKDAVRNFGEIFTESVPLFAEFGKRTADNFREGYNAVLTPKEKLSLFGLDDETKTQAIAQAQQTAMEVKKAVYDVISGPVVDDELDAGDIFGLDLELMKEIDAQMKELGLGAVYFKDQIKETTPIMEIMKNNAESIGFALGEMAAKGEASLKRLVQQILNMAQAIFLAKSASLGLPGIIAGLAGFGILKGLASQIGGGGSQTFVEGDKLKVVSQNTQSNNLRRF